MPSFGTDAFKGSSSTVPPGDDEDFTGNPLPPSEIPIQGGPEGGDFSTMYETNWDLWQNWMNAISSESYRYTLFRWSA